MDIRNVGNSGNVDANADRAQRADHKQAYVLPSVAKDDAQISFTGRKTAATVNALAERARTDETGRAAKVALAAEKLHNGELDGAAVLEETARRLADNGFFSA